MNEVEEIKIKENVNISKINFLLQYLTDNNFIKDKTFNPKILFKYLYDRD